MALLCALQCSLTVSAAGFAEQGVETTADKTAAQVVLLTAHVPPYVAPLGNGVELVSDKIEGPLVDAVVDYLEGRSVSYDLVMLPWSAAYRRALATPNALVFPLDRTLSREDDFHWIKHLQTNEYFIYGVSPSAQFGTTISDIVDENGQVSCTLNSIQCELLVEMGLPEENILRLEGASIPDRYRLLVRNRNQYSIFDPIVLSFLLKKHRLDGEKLIKLIKAGERESYLAASINTSPEMIEALNK
ncbi:MAG: hypothetical protein JJ850_11340 [Kordiimonadaceae bacterium]|nr:hypothetical protein [Kordiimonadaceae bacterium]MBO6568819.1 hypothetical protein [Kordiimonadaceae bacterium]MBO6965206.1 hypothetical protein [Kordiimonadaceae bacterium]